LRDRSARSGERRHREGERRQRGERARGAYDYAVFGHRRPFEWEEHMPQRPPNVILSSSKRAPRSRLTSPR
jgi:hypothetical protein